MSRYSGQKRKVADFYNNKEERDRTKRRQEDIYPLIAHNNWAKSTVLQACVGAGDTLLDLCGGKGGDLAKVGHVSPSSYTLVDISSKSVEQAKERYKQGRYRFEASFQVGDATTCSLPSNLDAVQCNFALNYLWEDPPKLLRRIYQSLKEGGLFFGVYLEDNPHIKDTSSHHLTFKRTGPRTHHFRLADKVDCEEYDIGDLVAQARTAGFSVVKHDSLSHLDGPGKPAETMDCWHAQIFNMYSFFILMKCAVHDSVGFDSLVRERSYLDPKRAPALYRSALHGGQLKLLLTEMRFFFLCGTTAATVVYAGAAPGTHLLLLADFFPHLHFELYDPAPFDPQLAGHKSFTLHNKCFALEDCHSRSGQLLFISDIRSSPPGRTSSETYDAKFEECVQKDMSLQRQWVESLKPAYSMLKFRLPFSKGVTSYFSGRLYIQPFAREASTEMRLVVRGVSSLRQYDHQQVERRLAYYNQRLRLVDCGDVVVEGAALSTYFGGSPVSFDHYYLVDTVRGVSSSGLKSNIARIVQFMKKNGLKSGQ